MEIIGAPGQLVLPWANGDSTKTNPIPVPSQIGVTPGAASFTDGFPPLCATPISSGGVPPAKADMNGGLFQMSGIDVWMSAGGGFLWSSAFSVAVGGYPIGARVLMASGIGGYWRSIVDNNTSNPDAGGAGWVPDSGSALLVNPFSGGITFPANLFTVGTEIEVIASATGSSGASFNCNVHAIGGSTAYLTGAIGTSGYGVVRASIIWNDANNIVIAGDMTQSGSVQTTFID